MHCRGNGHRNAGHSPYAGLAGCVEILLISPNVPVESTKGQKKNIQNTIKGKKSDIIMLAEGVCDAEELRAELKKRTGTSLRTVKLGHIQRGGTPSMADRVLGAKYAARAVDLLK